MFSVLIPFCIWFGCPDLPVELPEPPKVEAKVETSTILQVNEPEPVYIAPKAKWSDAVEQWRPLVAGQFPPEQVETALCVINAESRGDPKAYNSSSGAAGLWQFIPSTWDKMVRPALGGPSYAQGGPYSPELATLYAAWLWEAEGWASQWSGFRHC